MHVQSGADETDQYVSLAKSKKDCGQVMVLNKCSWVKQWMMGKNLRNSKKYFDENVREKCILQHFFKL